MIVLGIDPGIQRLGYALLEMDSRQAKPLSYGIITTQSNETKPNRFFQIYQDLESIIKTYKPDFASIETLIFAKNVKTALTISEVRGIIILLCTQYHLPVYEFTPLQIKMALTGYGRSKKPQVEKAVQMILKLPEIPKPDDISDALAIALCGGNHIHFQLKITKPAK